MKKYLCLLLVAALLCGCSAEVSQAAETTAAAETAGAALLAEPPAITKETEAAPSEAGKTALTTAETTATTAAVTNAAADTYDMPQEFYDKLYEIIGSYDHFDYYDISIAYRDTETGFELLVNPDVHYYSASVIKAVYMLYVYRLALAGKADLEQKAVYTEKYRREGTGVLKDMEYGTEFTVEELIGYSLEESDNSAFAMLKELFPEEGYEEYAASLGVHEEDARVRSGQICCTSSMNFSEEICRFIGEKNPYSEKLRYHLTHSRNAMICGGEGAEVVRKYGWYEGFFHDMAVVYGKKTYLLTIMTNLDMLEIHNREYGLFRDLSLLFADFSDKLVKTENAGDTVIIKIPKTEDDEMKLPNDPYMLLSVINMKLRDSYKSFDALCDDMEGDPAAITAVLEKTGYIYDAEVNQFVPKPEEIGTETS